MVEIEELKHAQQMQRSERLAENMFAVQTFHICVQEQFATGIIYAILASARCVRQSRDIDSAGRMNKVNNTVM